MHPLIPDQNGTYQSSEGIHCACAAEIYLLSALGISVGELVPAKQVGTMGLIIEPQGDSSFENYNDYGIPLAEGKA
jgi:hypothetical protein